MRATVSPPPPLTLQWPERAASEPERPARATPLRSTELRARVNAALATATSALGDHGSTAPRAPADVDAALAVLAGLMDRALGLPRATDRRLVVGELTAVYREVCAYRADQRVMVIAATRESLTRLREVQSAGELLQVAPKEVGLALGFDRVLVSQVNDSQWLPVSAYVRGDPAAGDALLAALGPDPELLTHRTLECDILRRRAALLVLGAQDHPRMDPHLAAASATRSYVAAPIMPEGEVIGFIHADYHLSGRHPDKLDRDALSAFAETFGALVQRTVLAGRLRAQTRLVRSTTAALASQLDELTLDRVRMSPQRPREQAYATVERVPEPCRGGRLESLLTKRELEVIELLATGARNREIAARLVVTEGTIKSHVKQILRKLRASNRAEAVSKYLRLAALPSGDAP
ncbi:sigma factor [Paraconexibacter sp. AEG42_29]|uniref:Sigma factor n=1 Tax=Paraconexibacter sp. AEG42_29 TaxID=2997339 RepID=A0AAU7AR11_9ACTN